MPKSFGERDWRKFVDGGATVLRLINPLVLNCISIGSDYHNAVVSYVNTTKTPLLLLYNTAYHGG